MSRKIYLFIFFILGNFFFASGQNNEKNNPNELIALGKSALSFDRYAEALNHFQHAYQLSEKNNDSTLMADALGSMAAVSTRLGNTTKALEEIQTALAMAKTSNNFRVISKCYVNQGIILNRLNKKDESIQSFQNALKYIYLLKDTSTIASIHSNLGVLYFDRKDYKEALKNYFISIEFNNYAKDSFLMINNFINIGEAYKYQNEYSKSLDFYYKALELAKSKHSVGDISLIYSLISETYAAKGNYDKAYFYKNLFVEMKDTVANLEQKKELLKLQTQFETERKDKVIARQLREADRQTYSKNLLLAGLFFLGLLVFISYNRAKYRQKMLTQLEHKNGIILEEKEKAEQLRSRAEESEAFKQQFLANMSHEIRTPLHAIVGLTNLLIEKPHNETTHKYLNIIKKSSDNLSVIINDILDISKLEVGKMKLENISFNLWERLSFVHDSMSDKANSKNINLVLSIDKDVPEWVMGDPTRLTQVLNNLVNNAIKFTDIGDIIINVSNSEEGIHFSIEDSGIGIAEEQLDKIFEGFVQANLSDNRKFGGTGLGLSISQNLVQLMGGVIKVTSTQGKGSVFSFTLPLKPSAFNLDQVIMKKQDERYYLLNKEVSVLIVEDNQYNQIVTTDSLLNISDKFKITLAQNGKEALEKIKNNTFDLILMDIQMPEMDGYEATQIIRKQFDNPIAETPIIALTASVVQTDIESCFQAGMNDYLPKPFQINQLAAIVLKYLPKDIIIEKKVNISNSSENAPLNNNTKLIKLLELTDGNKEQADKLLNIIISNLKEKCQKIHDALKEDKRDEIRGIIHSIRPQMIAIGLEEHNNLFDTIELNYANMTPTEYHQKIIILCNIFEKTLQELTQV